MKKITTMLLCALLCLSLLAGCGAKQEPLPSTGEYNELNVLLDWYPNAIHALLYQAEAAGYFAEENLHVNLIPPAESSDAITFVAAGRAQIGLTYPVDLINAAVGEGMPVQCIGAVAQKDLGRLVALKESNLGAKLENLSGGTIGHAGVVTEEIESKQIAAAAGLSEGEYELLDCGFDLNTALISRSADAVVGMFVNDEVITLRQEGYDLDVWEYSEFGVPDFYGLIMVAGSEDLKENPTIYERFLRACRKGFNDVKGDEELALKLIMEKMASDDNPLDETQQRGSYETLLPIMEPKGSGFLDADAAHFQEYMDWMTENGLLKEPGDPAALLWYPEA